jgi:hypothetical protein
MLKKAKQSWKDNFDKVLSSSESKEFAKVRKYYDDQYRQAIDGFLKMNKTTGFDNLFRVADIADIYSQIYVNIGVKFAKWYAKNFDKVVSKQTDVSGYTDIWAERFNNVSQQIAAERVTLVSGTAKATLVKVFKRLSSDPEFMVMNEREASRILRQKFGQYSKSQAERLVRTEATNAANFATLQSATDMFGQDNLQKEWMTALDGRERPAHRAADGQIVDFKGRFKVGGELLFNPGDPAGSAKNVVNCRCSTAPFPKPDAQAAGTIEGFGVPTPGTLPGTKPPKPPTGSSLSILKPVREVVEEVTEKADDIAFKSIKEAEDYFANNLGGKFTDLKGMDQRIANDFVNSIRKMQSEFPGLKVETLATLPKYRQAVLDDVMIQIKKSRYYKKMSEFYGVDRYDKSLIKRLRKILHIQTSNATAAFHSGKNFKWGAYGIDVNLSKYRGIVSKNNYSKRGFNKAVDEGKKMRQLEWWSKGSETNTFKHTSIHEIGHALDDQIQFFKEPEFIKYYERTRGKGEDYISNSLSKPFKANAYVKNNLSEYGSYNEKEFIAESLAEFYNSENPRQISKDVAEMMKRYWKKRNNKSMNKNQKINLDNEFDEFPEGFTIIVEPYGGGLHKPGDNYDKF